MVHRGNPSVSQDQRARDWRKGIHLVLYLSFLLKLSEHCIHPTFGCRYPRLRGGFWAPVNRDTGGQRRELWRDLSEALQWSGKLRRTWMVSVLSCLGFLRHCGEAWEPQAGQLVSWRSSRSGQRGPVPSGTLFCSQWDKPTSTLRAFSLACGSPVVFGSCLVASLRKELPCLAALRGPPGGLVPPKVPTLLC